MNSGDPRRTKSSTQQITSGPLPTSALQSSAKRSPSSNSVLVRNRYRNYHHYTAITPGGETYDQRVSSDHCSNQQCFSAPKNYTELPSIPRTTSTPTSYANSRGSSSYSPSGWALASGQYTGEKSFRYPPVSHFYGYKSVRGDPILLLPASLFYPRCFLDFNSVALECADPTYTFPCGITLRLIRLSTVVCAFQSPIRTLIDPIHFHKMRPNAAS